jgi:hypothetical protein
MAEFIRSHFETNDEARSTLLGNATQPTARLL